MKAPQSNAFYMVDSHCHFDFPEFDHDRSEVLDACANLGVIKILVPGIEPAQWPRIRQLALEHSALDIAVGVHPWWVNADEGGEHAYLSALNEKLEAQKEFDDFIAVGECGLDRMRGDNFALQCEVLAMHLEFANASAKPVILHCVKAHAELIEALKKHRPRCGGVVHAFSGSYDIAKAYIDLGFMLGIGGTITYARAAKTRAAVAKVPLSSLLLETDAPSMPLSGFQGERNSPLSVVEVNRCLAALRDLSEQELAEQTTKNYDSLFNFSK